MEKYRIVENEAEALADFLVPMLRWDQEERATAQEMLEHPWLKMPWVEETKMSEKEHNARLLKKKLMDAEDGGEPDQTVVASFLEGLADDEGSTGSDSESDFEVPHEAALFTWSAQRDMAKGVQLNNSFTGPYPKSYEGLFVDKGRNHQF